MLSFRKIVGYGVGVFCLCANPIYSEDHLICEIELRAAAEAAGLSFPLAVQVAYSGATLEKSVQLATQRTLGLETRPFRFSLDDVISDRGNSDLIQTQVALARLFNSRVQAELDKAVRSEMFDFGSQVRSSGVCLNLFSHNAGLENSVANYWNSSPCRSLPKIAVANQYRVLNSNAFIQHADRLWFFDDSLDHIQMVEPVHESGPFRILLSGAFGQGILKLVLDEMFKKLMDGTKLQAVTVALDMRRIAFDGGGDARVDLLSHLPAVADKLDFVMSITDSLIYLDEMSPVKVNAGGSHTIHGVTLIRRSDSKRVRFLFLERDADFAALAL